MRIGFFTDSYFPGVDGVTYTIDLWRERLESAGHEVYVVYPDGDYEPDDRELPVRSVPNPFYEGYRVPLLRRPSTLPELDVVHCHGPASVSYLGRYYGWKHDIPTIFTHHTPIEEYFEQSFKSTLLDRVLRRTYLPVETAFMGSFDVVTASTKQINRDVEHVQLPVGVDTEFFQPVEQDWFSEHPVIGYTGRISMEKHVEEILQAAQELPGYDFFIVGEGPRRDALEANAPENVTIRDFLPREELPVLYSSLDVFVTASTGDTLGLSTLEANACGTPVAATDVAPFTKTIGPENGERFEPGDTEAMATAIESCLQESRDTRDAVMEYAASRTLDQLETLYRASIDEDRSLSASLFPGQAERS
jgi:glycosyltransferase involved in cell wall biosynthesis